MARKTVPFNPKGIDKLPDNKPVVYRILTEGGKILLQNFLDRLG